MKKQSDLLTRNEARRLAEWWMQHTRATYQRFTVERSPTNPRLWAVVDHGEEKPKE